MARSPRMGLLAAVGAALLAAWGCCTGGSLRLPSGASQTGNLSKTCLLDDAQLIVVTADGKTYPKQAKVKKGVQVVVWIADADSLTIQFPATNPFPSQPTCAGRFCYSIQTANGAAAIYDYTGTIQRGTQSTPIDPRIEIMN